MLKSLISKQIIFHFLLILLLSTTMASHSRGLWPGDDWDARVAYFICRFSLETVLFLGIYYLFTVIPLRLNAWLRLIMAMLISWPIFVLAITMFDIVLGQPELDGALNGGESRIIAEFISELFWILPKHVSFCGLVALINFRLEHQNLFNFRFNLNNVNSGKSDVNNSSARQNDLIGLLSTKVRDIPLKI